MRKNLQLIVLLKNLTTGIGIPVLTLLVLAHGATISTVSLMIGAYSLTVVVAEFPSGLFADLCGRKRAFLLSLLLSLASYTLLLFCYSVPLLLLVMVLNGLGRAFASGSIDAIALEAAQGDAALVQVTSRLSILESAGLAAGALLGGVLAGIGTAYGANIAAILMCNVVLLGLTVFTVREPAREATGNETEEPVSLLSLLRNNFAFFTRPGPMRMLALLMLFTGFALLGLETYWQPGLLALSPPSWLLGVISSAGYAAVIVGSKLAERRLTRKPGAGVAVLLSGKVLLGLLLAALMLARTPGTFTLVYGLWYLVLGIASVAESTLLNRAAPARQRASILSLFSLLLQIGGLLGSLCGYFVSARTDYRELWLLGGTLLAFCALAYAGIRVFRRRRS